MKTYMAFIVQAYENKLDTGQIEDVTTITLVEKNAEKALARAKKIIKKSNYRITEVIENFIKNA